METDPETVPRAYARTDPRHWKNLTAEDIPHGWIDDMVKRLFEELNRQMLRAQHSSANALKKKQDGTYEDDTDARDQDSLILSRLQGSMQRLTKLEMERATLRTTKNARKRRDTRAAIRSKVLGALERAGNRDGGGESR
jgi:hypothetical protein